MNKWIEWFNVILPFTIFLMLSIITGILSKLLLTEQQFYPPNSGPRVKISSVSISETDSLGNLTSILKAESMVFFKGGISKLTNPNLTLFNSGNLPLRAKSDKAEINSKKNTARLTGSVIIKKIEANGKLKLKILTNDISFNLEKKVAFTNDYVEILKNNFRLTGEGMEINQKTQQIKILKNSTLKRKTI